MKTGFGDIVRTMFVLLLFTIFVIMMLGYVVGWWLPLSMMGMGYFLLGEMT